jgi:hypothetical protein
MSFGVDLPYFWGNEQFSFILICFLLGLIIFFYVSPPTSGVAQYPDPKIAVCSLSNFPEDVDMSHCEITDVSYPWR